VKSLEERVLEYGEAVDVLRRSRRGSYSTFELNEIVTNLQREVIAGEAFVDAMGRKGNKEKEAADKIRDGLDSVSDGLFMFGAILAAGIVIASLVVI
jgi:hypothetical protein